MNENIPKSPEKLLIEAMGRKPYIFAFIFQIVIYSIWYIYIFGVLGHVCPATYLGVWTASITGCVAFSGKRPRALGSLFSLFISAIIWVITFFFLHPNDSFGWEVEDPYRFINFWPFLTYAVAIILSIMIQIIIVNKLSDNSGIGQSTSLELSIEKKWSVISAIVLLVTGIAYFTVPWVKNEIWNNSNQDWFDTVFYPGDQWYLFMVIAVIGVISGVFLIVSLISNSSKDSKLKKIAEFSRIVGHSFFGMLIIGGFFIFIHLGSPTNQTK